MRNFVYLSSAEWAGVYGFFENKTKHRPGAHLTPVEERKIGRKFLTGCQIWQDGCKNNTQNRESFWVYIKRRLTLLLRYQGTSAVDPSWDVSTCKLDSDNWSFPFPCVGKGAWQSVKKGLFVYADQITDSQSFVLKAKNNLRPHMFDKSFPSTLYRSAVSKQPQENVSVNISKMLNCTSFIKMVNHLKLSGCLVGTIPSS